MFHIFGNMLMKNYITKGKREVVRTQVITMMYGKLLLK